MKEATGELNMTVITVVAIAAVGVFFYALIWPAIQANLLAQTHCSSAVNCEDSGDGKTMKCDYYQNDGTMTTGRPITCDKDYNKGNASQLGN